MKILYGVQGTGNGHLSRARAMAAAFKDVPQVDVQFLFSGRPASAYFDMDVFSQFETRRGMTFVSEAGRVNALKTVWHNSLPSLMREVRELDVSGFDLVISDFEPVTAHAARRQGVPSLSISHQAAFAYDVPKVGQSLIDRAVMRYFAPTEMKVGLHWYHFNQPILPPIIDLAQKPPSPSGAVLVYLPFESLDQVVKTLRGIATRFVCFHPVCQHITVTENVTLHPISKADFQQALMACDGVIANGGFELPSEALSLGKKLLLKPLNGQFEQQSNVSTLDMLGLASTMTSLDAGVIREWLTQREMNRVVYPNVARALAKWVGLGNWETLPALRDTLWSQVSYPEHVTDLLSDFWSHKRRKCAIFSTRLPMSRNKNVRHH